MSHQPTRTHPTPKQPTRVQPQQEGHAATKVPAAKPPALLAAACLMTLAGAAAGALITPLGLGLVEAYTQINTRDYVGLFGLFAQIFLTIISIGTTLQSAIVPGAVAGATSGAICGAVYVIFSLSARNRRSHQAMRGLLPPVLAVAGGLSGSIATLYTFSDAGTAFSAWFMAGGAAFGLLAGRILNERSPASVARDAGVNADVTGASTLAGSAWDQSGQPVPRRPLARPRRAALFTTFALGIGAFILLGLLSYNYVAQRGAPSALQPGDVLSPTNADSVVQLSQLNLSDVTQALYSSDGMWLVVATSRGVVLYDAMTMAAVRTLDTGPSATLALSPDGETLATSQGSTLQVWQVADGSLLYTLQGHTGGVLEAAFSPDNRLLAAASPDRAVRVWRVSNGELLHTLRHVGQVRSLDFRLDGQVLATGSTLGVTLWQPATGVRYRILSVSFTAADRVRYQPDGHGLAAGLDTGVIHAYAGADFATDHTLTGHSGAVKALAYSPDGQLLGSGGHDMIVRLWRPTGGAPLATLHGHQGIVTAMAFHPSGRMFVTAAGDSTVRVWGLEAVGAAAIAEATETPTVTPIATPTATPTPVPATATATVTSTITSPAIPPTPVAEAEVLTADNVEQMTEQARSEPGPILDLVYSPDGQWAAAALSDHVLLLDGQTLEPQGRIDISATVLAFHPDGESIATVQGTAASLWQLADGRLLRQFDVHSQPVTDLAFSPDGTILATAALDRRVRLWRTEDASLDTWFTHFGRVHSLAYSPDGGFLATGTSLGLSMWRLSDSTRLQIPLVSTNTANRMAFSPDGALLAVATDGGDVWLRRMDGQGEWLTLARHALSVRDVVFSPDGALLASASDDGTIRLWQTRDGLPLHTLLGHDAPVTALAFHPSGTALLSGSADGTVRRWGLEPVAGEEAEAAAEVVEVVEIEEIQFVDMPVDTENFLLPDGAPVGAKRPIECADGLIWASSHPLGVRLPLGSDNQFHWWSRDGIWSFDGQAWQQHFAGSGAVALCTPGGPPLVIVNMLEPDGDESEAPGKVALFARQDDKWIERTALLHPIVFDLFQWRSQWEIMDIVIDIEGNFWVSGEFYPTPEIRYESLPFLLRFDILGGDIYAPQAGLEAMRQALADKPAGSQAYPATRFHASDYDYMSVRMAPNGVLWMLTGEDVYRLDGSDWTHISTEHLDVFSVLDATGGFWVPTENGLVHRHAHGATRYEPSDSILLVPLAVDAQDRVWFWDMLGLSESGLSLIRYDGTTWQRYTYPPAPIFAHWMGVEVTDAAEILKPESVTIFGSMYQAYLALGGAYVASDGALWLSTVRIMPDDVSVIPDSDTRDNDTPANE